MSQPSSSGAGSFLRLQDQWRQEFETAASRQRRRRAAVGTVMRAVGALSMAIALFPLVDIVYVVAVKGANGLSPSVFEQVTNGVGGGLQNAILGTLALVAVGIVLAGTVGVGAGIFLSDWSSPRVARVLRYFTDVLTGVPSIVVGYFGYAVFVTRLGWGFSLVAGAISLAIIMVPYIARTTELSLRKVPTELREGALALGITKTVTTHAVALPVAVPGILTGLLLALGIGLGETAPLLYTAEWSNFNPSSLVHSPVGYLTYVVWTFIQEPFSEAHRLAYVAALLLMLGILALNLVARQVLARWDLRRSR